MHSPRLFQFSMWSLNEKHVRMSAFEMNGKIQMPWALVHFRVETRRNLLKARMKDCLREIFNDFFHVKINEIQAKSICIQLSVKAGLRQ